MRYVRHFNHYADISVCDFIYNMKKNNRETGAKAEAIACWFLKQQGYDVLEQNFYTKVGEIDIIAKEDQTLVFVEVKYRKDDKKG